MGLLDLNQEGEYLHPIIFEDTESQPLPGTEVPCLMCEKKFIMHAYSGEPDQICGSCWNTYQDLAKIICVHCKKVICRHKPGKLDNGFEIHPRMVMHTDACNVCRPGLTESVVIEIENWLKFMRPKKIIVQQKGLWLPNPAAAKPNAPQARRNNHLPKLGR